MNTRSCRLVGAAIALVNILLLGACGDRSASSSLHTPTQHVSTNDNPALKQLQQKAGITLPAGTVLLHSTDGGGRDPSHGFYAWALFSPTAIKMPAMKAAGVSEYVNLPLEDILEFVHDMMRNRRIAGPRSAYSTEWDANSYTFRGTLVQGADGDYLVIEQFLKK
jgi:hypothetical protein